MAETLINYGIFFAVLIVIAIIASVVKRSRMLSGLFKILGKSLLFLLQLGMLLVFTVIISMLVALIIFVHPYIYGTTHFFTNGEPLHFLAADQHALLSFSLTYGALYIILYFICGFIFAKTGIPATFGKISTRIRSLFAFHSRNNQFERKVVSTATHLIVSILLFVLYPIVITLFFPTLHMTFIGNATIFVSLLIFSILPVPGYENPWKRTRYYRAS